MVDPAQVLYHKFLCLCRLLLVPLRKLQDELNFCECCADCHSILYRAVVSFLLFYAPYCTAKFAEETATCDIISNGESNKTEGQKKKKSDVV